MWGKEKKEPKTNKRFHTHFYLTVRTYANWGPATVFKFMTFSTNTNSTKRKEKKRNQCQTKEDKLTPTRQLSNFNRFWDESIE